MLSKRRWFKLDWQFFSTVFQATPALGFFMDKRRGIQPSFVPRGLMEVLEVLGMGV